MNDTNKKKLIVILGPTAVGKTKLCVQLAQCLETEVVYADSRQLYKNMRICTAQPTLEEMQGVKHHFIDYLAIDTLYDASSYAVDGLALIDRLFEKYNSVILSGGTGLYINAVCHGIDIMPKVDESIRISLNSQFKTVGLSPLLDQLALQDPDYYALVDKKNPRRILRALEIIRTTGQPYSYFRKGNTAKKPFEILKLGINRDRSELYDRINVRVDSMLTEGLVEEVELLYPYKNYNSTQTIGCRELFSHFDGISTLQESISLIKQNTRRYAKRQVTWFQNDKEVIWYHPDNYYAIFEEICFFVNGDIKNK